MKFNPLFVVIPLALFTFGGMCDSRYYIVTKGDGKYYIEHRAFWGLYRFTSNSANDTLDQARYWRDNLWNPTNAPVKIVE